MEIPQIDPGEAARHLDAGDALFLDVRDEASYRASHVPGAVHVSDSTIAAFLEETEEQQTIIVYCYHGNASLGGAAFLREHGFLDVYSLRGGFEAWRAGHPQTGS